jgi:AhpD family alkylhydroperoxidase
LPKDLIDLVYLRVSQINGCAYCIDMHSRDLLKAGLAVEKLVLVPVWHESGALFSPRERAALAWAETVTLVAETGVPDDDYDAAAAEFNDKELADLTYAIGLMNAFNRFGVAFRPTPGAVAAAQA